MLDKKFGRARHHAADAKSEHMKTSERKSSGLSMIHPFKKIVQDTYLISTPDVRIHKDT